MDLLINIMVDVEESQNVTTCARSLFVTSAASVFRIADCDKARLMEMKLLVMDFVLKSSSHMEFSLAGCLLLRYDI
jgi:hypothetical protein